MTAKLPHVSVCICTFKRPQLLRRGLRALQRQSTEGLFEYSIVVADNDRDESARDVVTAEAAQWRRSIQYCVQPLQNIALTRNAAVSRADGDFIAFIDDDEFPDDNWLLELFLARQRFGADGVLGPVLPYFDEPPPPWVIEGKFYDRSRHQTGHVLSWRECRTGNVLLKSALLKGDVPPFDPAFLTGEDQDFFRRMVDDGHVFVWCNEAVAHEVIPPIRWKRSFLVKRALMRGVFSLRHRTDGQSAALTSLVAAPGYAFALPFALLAGQSRFMSCLFRFSYHAGRLFALVGINPIREPYVTQ
jgi:glycosyltransferase involved in cell wall biosynthesis